MDTLQLGSPEFDYSFHVICNRTPALCQVADFHQGDHSVFQTCVGFLSPVGLFQTITSSSTWYISQILASDEIPSASEVVRQAHLLSGFLRRSLHADANCKPMEIFPGHIVTNQGCKDGCVATVAKRARDLDSCIEACLAAGYSKCKSIQFKQSGTFGLAENECTLYSRGVRYMGAHATAQVLAAGGLGATVADFCEPPASSAQFPANDIPDFGVDWDAVCAGKQMATVPGMHSHSNQDMSLRQEM